MSTFVFVHGAFLGAWSWYKMVPLLEKAGHKVITPDMPGHGTDRSATLAAGSLRSYTDFLKKLLKDQDEPVILIAHSGTGGVISQVAEEVPEAVRKLVYIAAYLLPDGTNTFQYALEDKQTWLAGLLAPDEDGLIPVKPKFDEILFHDCPASDAALAKMLLVSEPVALGATTIHTSERFEKIPRVYIETLNDRAVGLDLQRSMYEKVPCEQVFSLETGHSPFFAAPDRLAEILVSIA